MPSPLPAPSQADIDQDIDAYLAEAGISPRPAGGHFSTAGTLRSMRCRVRRS
ncbi:DUF5956 family protein [Streptomyces sp. NPDC059900]|uniref:DUF5956 family protein n=1 Tax=Streptomyces sp. NPDC059900 TaxID=3155816 RepID=UPI00341D49A7